MTACFCFLWEKGKKKKKKRVLIRNRFAFLKYAMEEAKKTFTFLFQRPQQPHWQGIVNPSLPFAQQTKVVQTSDFSSFTTASKATHKHRLKEIQTWSNNNDNNNWCRKLQANKRKKPWLKKNQNRGKSYCTPHQKKWIKKYGTTSATGAYRWPKDNEERKRKNQQKKQRTEACRCKQSSRDAKRKGSQSSSESPERQREREGCRKVPCSHCPAFFIQENPSSMDVVKVLK